MSRVSSPIDAGHLKGPINANGAADDVAEIESAEAELASRLRLAVTRLHRRLRQQSVWGVAPAPNRPRGQHGTSRLAHLGRAGLPRIGAASLHDPHHRCPREVGAGGPGCRSDRPPGGEGEGERGGPLSVGAESFAEERVSGSPVAKSDFRRAGCRGRAVGVDRATGRGARAVTSIRNAWNQTFHSLRVRNYRVYFIAQLISVSGTWMQSIAQAWLVLHLTGSGVDLGIVTGLQFLPVLLFGPFGGLVADRLDKRKLLFATQTAGGLLALTLGILTVTHVVQLWQVYVLAGLLGVVNLFDNPARQTFVMEMVGREDLPNAVSLNSVVMNASRVVGPAIGGLVIVLFGLGICFFVNAVSYVAVLIGLAMMRVADLHRTPPVEIGRAHV